MLGITDSNGTLVAEYRYDAYGKPVKILDGNGNDVSTNYAHIANINPIRYRGYYYDIETGFYYLQSRYYDPEIGRFINADTLIDIGAGIAGYNLYIYAANNPVNNYDPSGHWIIKDAIKWMAGKLIKPTSDYLRNETANFEGTITKGINLSGAFGIGGSLSIGITTDLQGNIGLIGSASYSSGTPSASICAFETITTAPDIFKQRGEAVQIGGSADIFGLSAGIEYSVFQDDKSDRIYHSGTALAGIGAPIPAELHGEISNSFVIGFNIFDEISKVCIRISEW